MGRITDKAFYTLLIPTACVLFLSAPAMVLRAYSDPLQETAQAAPQYWQRKINVWWKKQAWPTFPVLQQGKDVEIPLVFLHEKYPNNGHKTLRLHDKKYLKMAEMMQKNNHPSELGYVYIFDAKDAKELPKGELIQVNGYEWKDDGCLLSTTRKRSFRIKSIRRDAQQGIMYAKVEWI
ncbi:Aste57867_18097 [Aphanomyces stellatus]|uniref:Aste57867_18097 protein n=1 Tax=Aphanomyces stellatus TaxID=120398 RepID=A0A485L973_9STRA|nr:hypothetical protein As57867_018035 [Aphanomyces stellatus]VFT94835.1 Aste57867_18097 [Aphanomyces stellatus]